MNARNFLVATALLCSSVSLYGDVAAELSLRPRVALPGQSVEMHLRLVTRDSSIQMSRVVRIRVVPPSGNAFIAKWTPNADYGLLDIVDERDLFVSPHTVADFYLEPRFFGSPSWSTDLRLMAVGTYGLQMLFYESGNTVAPIGESSVVRFDVSQPDGDDSRIVQRLIDGTVDSAFAEAMLEQSPHSTYVPYLLGFIRRDALSERIKVCEHVLSIHPNTPLGAALRLWIATLYDSESRTVFAVRHDLDAAASLAERERTILDLMRTESSEWGRAIARRTLDDGIPSRESFVRTREP